MTAFLLSVDYVSLPHASSIEELMIGDFVTKEKFSGDESWQSFTYDCILKAKSLFVSLKDSNLPTIWLMPAWVFQSEQKEIVIESFYQLFAAKSEFVFFLGSSGIDAAIQFISEQGIDAANVIAIDGVYLPNSSSEYCYHGVGGIVATLDLTSVGWSQRFFCYEASIDFEQHDAFGALFKKAIEDVSVDIDTIFSPGNGIDEDGDIWLHSLQLLAPHLGKNIEYIFPVYTLGKLGAVNGVMNLYSLINNPNYSSQKHALMISQEQSVHQAVGVYIWKNEETRR